MKTYYNDAKETFNTEITALEKVRDELDESFDQVVDAVLATTGRLIFIAIGKSGIIAERLQLRFHQLVLPVSLLMREMPFTVIWDAYQQMIWFSLSLIVVKPKRCCRRSLPCDKFLMMN